MFPNRAPTLRQIYEAYKEEFIAYAPVGYLPGSHGENGFHPTHIRLFHSELVRYSYPGLKKRCMVHEWSERDRRWITMSEVQMFARMTNTCRALHVPGIRSAIEFFFFNRFTVAERMDPVGSTWVPHIYWATYDAPTVWCKMTTINAINSLQLRTRALRGD